MITKLKFRPGYRNLLAIALFLLAFVVETKACNPHPQIIVMEYDSAYLFMWSGGYTSAQTSWDFGDGQTHAGRPYGEEVWHKYAKNGKYLVTMYYWDTINYCRDTATLEVCYYRLDSLPVFRRSGDTLIASAQCLPKAFYRWWFGDNSLGLGCTARHVYAKPGFYSPSLMFVRDSITGCTYNPPTSNTPLDFTDCGFSSRFYTMPYKLKAVTWSAPFLTIKKMAGRETWLWGDGTSTINNILQQGTDTHFYALPGTYNLCHVLEDSTGQCIDSTCQSVKIEDCDAVPKYSYTINGRTVKFTNESPMGIKFEWLVDGQPLVLDNNSSYTFSLNGVYKVCLKVTGTDYCTKATCMDIEIKLCETPDKISWEWHKDDCATATFTNLNKNYSHYVWNFGDGTPDTVIRNPVHTFAKNGRFLVKLLALDTSRFNCRDSFFIEMGRNCCEIKDSVVLKYTSSHSATLENHTYIRTPRGPVHRHFWDFGDGNTSTQSSPKHVYTVSKKQVKIMYVATDTIRDCRDTVMIYLNVDSLGNPFVLNTWYYTSVTAMKLNKAYSLYPNPFSGQLVLEGEITGDVTGISLFNSLGQEMPLSYVAENDRCIIRVPEDLAAGVYLLRLSTSSGIETVRVFRE
jgi:PKD repeat protein